MSTPYSANLSYRGEDWRAQARCGGLSEEAIDLLFFPETGKSGADGKEFCATCPVWEHCLAWALTHPAWTDIGIWGRTNERQRRDLRSGRKTLAQVLEENALPPAPPPAMNTCRRCNAPVLAPKQVCADCRAAEKAPKPSTRPELWAAKHLALFGHEADRVPSGKCRICVRERKRAEYRRNHGILADAELAKVGRKRKEQAA